MQKTEKERVVAELTQQLQSTDSLIVADYRGLTNGQLEELRTKLRAHGARFSMSRTRSHGGRPRRQARTRCSRCSKGDGDRLCRGGRGPVASRRRWRIPPEITKIMSLRGGVMEGCRSRGGRRTLAKLPPVEVLQPSWWA